MADQPRGEVELTDGARHPGSISNLAETPGTEFGYVDRLESGDKLLFAGQYSYEDLASAGGLATEWLPAGDPGTVTSLVMRESRVGPMGPIFRGLRLDHESVSLRWATASSRNTAPNISPQASREPPTRSARTAK
jgi:hypothetical protein